MSNLKSLRALCLVAVLFVGAFAAADTLYVNVAAGNDAWDGYCELWDGGTCGPKATIQAGINAAAAGDDILVAPGTYFEAIDFLGKAVNLHSAAGPEVTIIDATGLDASVVTCASGEGPSTVLAGFTITGGAGTPFGHGTFGGGLYNVASSPTVRYCNFLANSCSDGGGIANVDGSAPTITDCIFNSNWGWDHGGGITNEYSSPYIARCTFQWNVATYGGGIENHYEAPYVIDCLFFGNSASGGGGGQDTTESDGTAVNCVFSANYAGHGAAWYSNGGAVWVEGGSPLFVNCTMTENWAAGHHPSGGGLCDIAGFSRLRNCIIWGNAPTDVEAYFADITYSDIGGGYLGAGNFDVDPVFVRNPWPGPDGHWETEDDDFGDLRLTSESLCIDAGDPALVPIISTDLDENKRIWDGDMDGTAIVDMGAYEFESHPYADLNCDGAINVFDIDPFALALTDPSAYALGYPGCSATLGDLNGDGVVNVFDIDPFVVRLTGG
jgi:hypothetical protein